MKYESVYTTITSTKDYVQTFFTQSSRTCLLQVIAILNFKVPSYADQAC